MLYRMYAQMSEAMRPWNVWVRHVQEWLYQPWNPLNHSPIFRSIRASFELVERMTDSYDEPEWELDSTVINGQEVAVSHHVVVQKPYCDLRHFQRHQDGLKHPRVLMVAPLSGHYATLLRATVKEFLPDHEVYITDWRNARDVPMSQGVFRFDDYVEYLIEFMEHLGPDTHVLAVCQPCVPTLAAIGYMAMMDHPAQPISMTLMGGPVDTRNSPTGVNEYAGGKNIEWFEENVICRVPAGFRGKGQLVYPGFLQLGGFITMNLDSHMNKHVQFFNNLVKGDGDSAEAHRKFYNEYLAVMDMPAQYYLDTIRKVFLEHQLPRGELEFRGKRIDLTAIKKVALFTIEGENDDITGRGQTSCTLELCQGIDPQRKQHYEVPEVGHYGIFSGRRFRENVAPRVKKFMSRMAESTPVTLNAAPSAPALVNSVATTSQGEAVKPAISKAASRPAKAVVANKSAHAASLQSKKPAPTKKSAAKQPATKSNAAPIAQTTAPLPASNAAKVEAANIAPAVSEPSKKQPVLTSAVKDSSKTVPSPSVVSAASKAPLQKPASNSKTVSSADETTKNELPNQPSLPLK